jgi:hypothetical protein
VARRRSSRRQAGPRREALYTVSLYVYAYTVSLYPLHGVPLRLRVHGVPVSFTRCPSTSTRSRCPCILYTASLYVYAYTVSLYPLHGVPLRVSRRRRLLDRLDTAPAFSPRTRAVRRGRAGVGQTSGSGPGAAEALVPCMPRHVRSTRQTHHGAGRIRSRMAVVARPRQREQDHDPPWPRVMVLLRHGRGCSKAASPPHGSGIRHGRGGAWPRWSMAAVEHGRGGAWPRWSMAAVARLGRRG